MIVEMKDKPENLSVSEKDGKMILVIRMLNEDSAKGIDLDVSNKELKLKSENYEMTHKFSKEVDSDDLKCRFSKKAHELTLTLSIL
jgi:hypothetical protein